MIADIFNFRKNIFFRCISSKDIILNSYFFSSSAIQLTVINHYFWYMLHEVSSASLDGLWDKKIFNSLDLLPRKFDTK